MVPPDVPLPPGCPPTADRRGWLSAHIDALDESFALFARQIAQYKPPAVVPDWLMRDAWVLIRLRLRAVADMPAPTIIAEAAPVAAGQA